MNASRDENFKPTLIGLSELDGQTILLVAINPITHGIKTSDATTGSDFGPSAAGRDENNVTTLMGVSSSDFKTPVPVYVNSSNQLLIDSA